MSPFNGFHALAFSFHADHSQRHGEDEVRMRAWLLNFQMLVKVFQAHPIVPKGSPNMLSYTLNAGNHHPDNVPEFP